MDNKENTVFLSYAREDIEAANRLYKILTSVGINVWFDKESLSPGVKWKPAINVAIRECRYFIALLSSRSISKRGFVQSEIKQAIDVLEQYPENEIYIVPVRLDECEVTHEKLNDLNWVDLFPEWKDGQDKLLRLFGVQQGEQNASRKESSTISRLSLAPTVRLDGLYQIKRGSDWNYLRFYGDGSVIAATVAGDNAQKVFEWFTKEWAVENTEAKGRFTISGAQITFVDSDKYGDVDYEGEIQGDHLILRWHSHINDNRGVGEYEFVTL
ncbi:MAG TPA: toll/interleukin-1 receptor domain-containing protein [Nitrososphaera sp.]|nr:toll/interleukin-1 receptor domain-containing protein [Nitrososphaera sp.]